MRVELLGRGFLLRLMAGTMVRHEEVSWSVYSAMYVQVPLSFYHIFTYMLGCNVPLGGVKGGEIVHQARAGTRAPASDLGL